MEQDRFQWIVRRVWDAGYIRKVDLLIAVSVNGQNLPNYDSRSRDHHNMMAHSTDHNCEQIVRVEHKSEKSVTETLYIPLSHHKFCLFFTCYFSHITKGSNGFSWNDADIFCRKRKSKLITINSDIQSKNIETLLSADMKTYLSPVIFLNMKQDKVCAVIS